MTKNTSCREPKEVPCQDARATAGDERPNCSPRSIRSPQAEREGNKDEGMDTYDLASEERDREINFILSDRERVKLKQIDDALERLDDGSYGVCESCGLEDRRGTPRGDAVYAPVPRLSAGRGARSEIAAPIRRRTQRLSQGRLDRRRRRQRLARSAATLFTTTPKPVILSGTTCEDTLPVLNNR